MSPCCWGSIKFEWSCDFCHSSRSFCLLFSCTSYGSTVSKVISEQNKILCFGYSNTEWYSPRRCRIALLLWQSAGRCGWNAVRLSQRMTKPSFSGRAETFHGKSIKANDEQAIVSFRHLREKWCEGIKHMKSSRQQMETWIQKAMEIWAVKGHGRDSPVQFSPTSSPCNEPQLQ